MAKSKVKRKSSQAALKPYPDFPLTAHASGVWCKKIKGKLYYFGPVADHDAALKKYLDTRDDLQAGRKPRKPGEAAEPTVMELANRFLTVKQGRVHSGELSLRTFHDYKRSCANVLDVFGKERVLSDLDAEDFEKLRVQLATGRGMVSLGNGIRLVRILFAYAFEVDMIDKPFKFLKSAFRGPSKKDLRKEKNAKPARMFEAADLRKVLGIAGVQLRAMILLGINAGFGQSDLSALPITAVDLDAGWIDFPRVKTHVQRRCPLWPETVEALRVAIAKRPTPKAVDAERCLFVTKYGKQWVRSVSVLKGTYIDSIGLEFGKLLTDIGLKVPKSAKQDQLGKGLNFYAIRHTFETVAGEARDQIPVDFIMGHAPASDDMSAVYREQISDPRLKAITDHVRLWLWPEGSEAAWITAEAEREQPKEAENVKPVTKRKTKAPASE